ncbi:MAG: PHP domain-containing protein [Bacteroidota bacterium]|nr:PHP domain-containing protein [Bacteroidota bacterium]
MNIFKGDLHIHTVLSPCGDLEMSPSNIIHIAKSKQLDLIGITDHNTTRQCKIVRQIGQREGIFVLCGVEVTTKEEAHCLAFFETLEALEAFQVYLDAHLPEVKNDPDLFGYQVVVDEDDNILYEEERSLLSAIDQSIEKIEQMTHSLNGIFIPAHVNKGKNSIISQLGFVPDDLKADALELSKHIGREKFINKNKYLKNNVFIRSSDAHLPELIGETTTLFVMENLNFEEIRKALHNIDNRRVITE